MIMTNQAIVELNAALKQLKESQTKSTELRKTFLDEWVEVEAHKHNNDKKSALRAIMKAEEIKKIYSRIWFTLKDSSSGATSRILIPNPDDTNYLNPKEWTMWDKIDHPDDIDKLPPDNNHAQLRYTHQTNFSLGYLQ